jgi:hypothetical protein
MRVFENLGWLFLGFSFRRRFQWMLSLSGNDLDPPIAEAPSLHTSTINTAASSILKLSTLSKHPVNSSMTFLFVIGLEKTGHHLLESIAEHSPMKQRLSKLVTRQEQNLLHRHLFSHQIADGLWNAHCLGQDVDTIFTRNKIAALLQTIELRMRNESSPHLIYPINTLEENGDEGYGMISYPNFWGPCRFLAYPNLDLWYEACDMAHVDCKQVYLYRNPYAIVESTVSKEQHPTMLHAIHMYTSMLHISSNHLQVYANRTIGCFGFFENNTTSSWWEAVRTLWGWSEDRRADYGRLMKELYRPPPPPPTNASLATKDFELYMRPLWKLHRRVVRICQDSLG